jgi:2-oxoglutarate dehydrogenase E2 component (dihydrolipoamide succinyltransferase)
MEGTVLTWHKQPGDAIESDEILLEIGTDKVDSEIPSPSAGTLAEIVVPEGETVAVGTVIAVISTEVDESVSQSPVVKSPQEEPVTSTPASAPPDSFTVPGDGAVVEVIMPKMGESVMEGTVLTWHKQPGDSIESDETLLEIGTDKVDSEIPSPSGGVLQTIDVAEGETVAVGTVLATISAEGSQLVEISTPPQPARQTAPPTSAVTTIAPSAQEAGGDGLPSSETPRRGSDGRFYSPLVRSIAKAEGVSTVELGAISGSGREGRVTKGDILLYVDQRQSQGTPQPFVAATAVIQGAPDTSNGSRTEIIEMDRMRQVIAQHMTRSLATSAHVTSFAEADVTNLVRLREANKESFEAREGVRLTYTPFFVKAAVDALREHPILNASVEEHRIVVKKDFHVGIAVAIDRKGLVVPVIRFAGGMNVSGLAHAASDLASRARSKQLQPDELQGGTFTVTNVGSLGSLMGTPIVNQPQVAILATGAITKRAVVKEHPDLGDVIVVRHMVYLSLSYDHRIIDGAMGSSFLRHLVTNLEAIGADYPL